jgi:proline iminopeptidase
MSYISTIHESEWTYPQPKANTSGLLNVSQLPAHSIYWEEYGNPKGEPVLFIHGGPGGGTAPVMARFFDPKRYRIILFDQRGCGKSVPSAAEDDPLPALADNSTPHLIGDIIQLRAHLNISGKMHVFGGSWGSTLALAYAIAHPETVATLILRGIFLCRRKDLDFFYQGNAAYYADAPGDTRLPGTYLCYPEAWKSYVEVIPPTQRSDMIKAYARRFAMQAGSDQDKAYATEVATAWSVWEGVTSYLAPDSSDHQKFADPVFARAFARIENHYFMNGAFLGGSGEENRNQDYLLSHIMRIKDIPVAIVHGRYDLVCPLFQAEELVSALRNAGNTAIDYRITAASHSMMERENALALVNIMDNLPALS